MVKAIIPGSNNSHLRRNAWEKQLGQVPRDRFLNLGVSSGLSMILRRDKPFAAGVGFADCRTSSHSSTTQPYLGCHLLLSCY